MANKVLKKYSIEVSAEVVFTSIWSKILYYSSEMATNDFTCTICDDAKVDGVEKEARTPSIVMVPATHMTSEDVPVYLRMP